MVDFENEPIELVPSRYEEWRRAFVRERERIESVLAQRTLARSLERIEHVGSSAVPDLAAKDIVDLNVVVSDDRVDEVSDVIVTALGGTRVSNGPDWHPIFREEAGQRFNVHVFAASADEWRISVVTRDVLRSEPGLRSEYESLKRELAGVTDDLETYSRGKIGFLSRLLERARTSDELSYGFEIPEVDH